MSDWKMEQGHVPWVLPKVEFPCRPRRWFSLLPPIVREALAFRRAYPRREGYAMWLIDRKHVAIKAPSYDMLGEIIAAHVVDASESVPDEEREWTIDLIMATAYPVT